MPANNTSMSCPVCSGAFREVLREGVHIDVCTQCRGVWLDRGELEKLLSLAREESGEDLRDRDVAPRHSETRRQAESERAYRPEERQRDDRGRDDRHRYDRDRDDRYSDDRYRSDDSRSQDYGPPKKRKGFDFLDIFEFGD